MNLVGRTQLDETPKQLWALWLVRCPFGILNLVLVLSTTRARVTLINTFHAVKYQLCYCRSVYSPAIYTYMGCS